MSEVVSKERFPGKDTYEAWRCEPWETSTFKHVPLIYYIVFILYYVSITDHSKEQN
jgi:hypothetical protein